MMMHQPTFSVIKKKTKKQKTKKKKKKTRLSVASMMVLKYHNLLSACMTYT